MSAPTLWSKIGQLVTGPDHDPFEYDNAFDHDLLTYSLLREFQSLAILFLFVFT